MPAKPAPLSFIPTFIKPSGILLSANSSYFLEVAASTEHLAEIRNFVGKHARAHGFGSSDIEEIRLAVDEAITNVIKHAYRFDASGRIYISVGSDKKHFWIAIQDSGRAFDIDAYTEPNIQQRIAERKKGGVGVYLIKRLMDKVEYSTENHHNQIRMIKKL